MGSKIQSQNEEMLSSNADHLSKLSGRQISIEASIDPQHSLKDTSNGNQESIEDPETYKQPLLYENYHPNPNLSLSRGSFHNFLEPEPCGIWQKKENCQSNFPKSQQQYVNTKLLVSTV